jgi:hypothetical protein
VSGRTLHLAAIEPLVIVLRPENGRHAIVDGAYLELARSQGCVSGVVFSLGCTAKREHNGTVGTG